MAGKPPHSHRRRVDTRDPMQAYTVESVAEAFLIERRWPEGIVCPHCGHDDVHFRDSSLPTPFRCRGKGCRRFFSVRTGTMLQSSNLPLTTWVLAFFLCSTNFEGTSYPELHRLLQITRKSAWHLAHRIREAWDGRASRKDGSDEKGSV